MSSDRPIFLVGCPRSGTTLLSAMLHTHPRIAVAPETRFLLRIYRTRARFGDLTVAENRRKLAEFITRPEASRFRDLGLDRQQMIARIVDAPPTFGSAAATVWREYAHSRGKARWGEKRPAYWTDMDAVLRLFPNAQVIHIVRDGRACVASLKQMEWWQDGALGAMATWTLADRALRRVGRRLPADSYSRVRYEDLLADPTTVLGRLCTFLGEDFDEAMLDHVDAARDLVPSRKTWHDRTKGDLDLERIAAWRTALDPAEVSLFERVAGRALRANGYELSGAQTRPSPGAVRAYYAIVARHLAKRTRFQLRDARQRRRDHAQLASLL